jgi:hypothetical protein
MERKELQTIALLGLNALYPEEGNILEIFEEYGVAFPMQDFGNFMNLQMITPGYIDFGSSPFHWKITEKGRSYIKSGNLQIPLKTNEPVLTLSLKPYSDPNKSLLVYQSLLNLSDHIEDVPFISYGLDSPESFTPFTTKDNIGAVEDIHEACLNNLKNISPQIHESDISGLKAIICMGDYYTCEKILDEDFMRQMQDRIGSIILAVSIPRKGTMYITDAMMSLDLISNFIGITAMKYEADEQTLPLSKTVFTVQDGKIIGFIRQTET